MKGRHQHDQITVNKGYPSWFIQPSVSGSIHPHSSRPRKPSTQEPRVHFWMPSMVHLRVKQGSRFCTPNPYISQGVPPHPGTQPLSFPITNFVCSLQIQGSRGQRELHLRKQGYQLEPKPVKQTLSKIIKKGDHHDQHQRY